MFSHDLSRSAPFSRTRPYVVLDETVFWEGRKMARETGSESDLSERAAQELRRFGELLNELRIEHGAPSVASLVNAKILGMSKGNLSAIFNGTRLPGADVTAELVRAIAKNMPDAEWHRLESDWRRRWQEVKRTAAAADKAARQARAANSRTAEDIIAAARKQAEEIIAAAAEQAGELHARAHADTTKVRADVQARADAEVARLTGEALKGNHPARVLMLAQRTADQAIAEVRNEANKILEEARRKAAQMAAGLTTEQHDALDAAGQVTGAVDYCMPEGLLVRLVDPPALAGIEAYIHTGKDIAARMVPGRRVLADISRLLTHPVLVAQWIDAEYPPPPWHSGS